MSKKEDKEILLERFDIFYKAYPRKVSKGQAIKTWLKLAPDEETLDKMLKAIKWQKGTIQWQNKSYIPHPSTWLNAMKWEDEMDTELMVGCNKSQEEELMELMAKKRNLMRSGSK